MSEIDNPQPNVEDDAEDTAIVNTNGNDGIEATNYGKLRDGLKNYLALYTTERNEIMPGLLKQADWDDYLNRNNFLRMFNRDNPLMNYETRLNNIVLDNDYAQAIEDAFLTTPKITKNIIKGMCEITKIDYLENEQDIDFTNLIDRLVEMSLEGAGFLCTKMTQSIKMNKSNHTMLTVLENLSEIELEVFC